MGLHYVNLPLVFDGVMDPTRPEIILYEPLPNGRLRLTGADFLVLADDWDAAHPGGAPQLMGQLFHRFESPNRFGLPRFYTLHVWAWKESPTGTFVNWHYNVSCDGFSGATAGLICDDSRSSCRSRGPGRADGLASVRFDWSETSALRDETVNEPKVGVLVERLSQPLVAKARLARAASRARARWKAWSASSARPASAKNWPRAISAFHC